MAFDITEEFFLKYVLRKKRNEMSEFMKMLHECVRFSREVLSRPLIPLSPL